MTDLKLKKLEKRVEKLHTRQLIVQKLTRLGKWIARPVNAMMLVTTLLISLAVFGLTTLSNKNVAILEKSYASCTYTNSSGILEEGCGNGQVCVANSDPALAGTCETRICSCTITTNCTGPQATNCGQPACSCTITTNCTGPQATNCGQPACSCTITTNCVGPTPTNCNNCVPSYQQPCTELNSCLDGNDGTTNCDGSCSVTAPLDPSGANCDSTPNNCGEINVGEIGCDGCTALQPIDRTPCLTPSCGDNQCNGTETAASCPADCGPATSCGDNICNGGETNISCPADCTTPAVDVCGDNLCGASETSITCAVDCGPLLFCGDNICNAAETYSTCSQDCPNPLPNCGTDSVCIPPENSSNCPVDCGTVVIACQTNIGDACRNANKTCNNNLCGGCLSGFTADANGNCVNNANYCNPNLCAPQNRFCDSLLGCTGCLDGFTQDAGGTCISNPSCVVGNPNYPGCKILCTCTNGNTYPSEGNQACGAGNSGYISACTTSCSCLVNGGLRVYQSDPNVACGVSNSNYNATCNPPPVCTVTTGTQCGTDNCGTNHGSCSVNEICSNGNCIAGATCGNRGSAPVNGQCCTPGDTNQGGICSAPIVPTCGYEGFAPINGTCCITGNTIQNGLCQAQVVPTCAGTYPGTTGIYPNGCNCTNGATNPTSGCNQFPDTTAPTANPLSYVITAGQPVRNDQLTATDASGILPGSYILGAAPSNAIGTLSLTGSGALYYNPPATISSSQTIVHTYTVKDNSSNQNMGTGTITITVNPIVASCIANNQPKGSGVCCAGTEYNNANVTTCGIDPRPVCGFTGATCNGGTAGSQSTVNTFLYPACRGNEQTTFTCSCPANTTQTGSYPAFTCTTNVTPPTCGNRGSAPVNGQCCTQGDTNQGGICQAPIVPTCAGTYLGTTGVYPNGCNCTNGATNPTSGCNQFPDTTAPTANPLSYVITAGQPVRIDQLTAGDTTSGINQNSFVLGSAPSNAVGTINLSPSGSLSYTPPTSTVNSVTLSYQYTVKDNSPNQNTGTGTITITVNPIVVICDYNLVGGQCLPYLCPAIEVGTPGATSLSGTGIAGTGTHPGCNLCASGYSANSFQDACVLNACPTNEERVNGTCVARCGVNSTRNTAGVCACNSQFESYNSACVAVCPVDNTRNASGVCVLNACPTNEERVNGTCVAVCTGGQVRGTSGVCACTSPLVLNNGVCSDPGCPSGEEKVNNVCVPVCTGGQVRGTDGRCACSTDKDFVGGSCVVKCGAYSTRNTTTGVCACNSGYELSGLACVPVCTGGQVRGTSGTCACASPLVLNNGVCTDPGCPSGEEKVNDRCVAICTGGQIRGPNGTCACAAGQDLVRGTCVPVCTGGQVRGTTGTCACASPLVLNNGVCSDPGCPSGEEKLNNVCKPVCTGGQVRGTNGTCACATGKEFVGGSCIAICPTNTARNTAGVCAPTVCSTDPTVDTDGDGIKDVVEAVGPNNGDGNGDGIKDCLQKGVASGCTRPDKCSTIVVTGSCDSFGKTGIIKESDLPIQDPVYDYPFGLYTFEVACTGTAQLVTYWYGVPNTPSQITRKYGPTTPGDDSTAKFFDFPNDSRELIVVGGQSALKITQTLRDGGFGDATGVDGIIKDPMGLAVLAVANNKAPATTIVKTGSASATNVLFAISALSVLALGVYAVFITRSRQMATHSIRSKKE